MDRQLYEALQVRFVKLRITIAFSEFSILPKDKVSALRGGMGEMLLSMNCVRNRECFTCDFKTECNVQRTLYSKFEKKPAFVTSEGSIGYLLECENYRERFKPGDTLDFYLVLFGKTIVHFSQFVQAFRVMGKQNGIGRNHARFRIVDIRNTEGQPFLNDGVLDMDKYVVHSLYDYIMFRKMRMDAAKQENKIVFATPLTLKNRNEYLQEFQMIPILNAVRRRIYMLDCYEGIECDRIVSAEDNDIPEILYQKHHLVGVHRYSTRKNEKMTLRGIKGYMLLSHMPQETVDLLLAGELTHIGKNTSFGFGRYHFGHSG